MSMIGRLGTINCPGLLSGTMTTAGASGNKRGYSFTGGYGVVTATIFPMATTLVSKMEDDIVANTFTLNLGGTAWMDVNSISQIVINGRTFSVGNINAAFSAALGLYVWQWSNGGVQVTANGVAYAIS